MSDVLLLYKKLTFLWLVKVGGIEWDGVDLLSEEFGLTEVGTPRASTPPDGHADVAFNTSLGWVTFSRSTKANETARVLFLYDGIRREGCVVVVQ